MAPCAVAIVVQNKWVRRHTRRAAIAICTASAAQNAAHSSGEPMRSRTTNATPRKRPNIAPDIPDLRFNYVAKRCNHEGWAGTRSVTIPPVSYQRIDLMSKKLFLAIFALLL